MLSPLPALARREERYTCHHSRALLPQRDTGRHGEDQPWGRTVPSCLQTDQVPSSSSSSAGTAAEALCRGLHAGLALLPWEPPGAAHPSSAVRPGAALRGSPSPARPCQRLRPRGTPLPACAPSHALGPPPRPPARPSTRRPPNPAGARATHRSPALPGEALRFDGNDLELRGGSLPGEAARSGLPGEPGNGNPGCPPHGGRDCQDGSTAGKLTSPFRFIPVSRG